jgi:hypothetical protein
MTTNQASAGDPTWGIAGHRTEAIEEPLFLRLVPNRLLPAANSVWNLDDATVTTALSGDAAVIAGISRRTGGTEREWILYCAAWTAYLRVLITYGEFEAVCAVTEPAMLKPLPRIPIPRYYVGWLKNVWWCKNRFDPVLLRRAGRSIILILTFTAAGRDCPQIG